MEYTDIDFKSKTYQLQDRQPWINLINEMTPFSKKRTFFHFAATFCLCAPFIGIALNIFLWIPSQTAHPPHTQIDIAADMFLAAFVPVLGAVAGLVSLLGIPRYGRSGILWKAATGLFIFVFMVLVAIPNYLKAREVAHDRYQHLYEQQKNDSQ